MFPKIAKERTYIYIRNFVRNLTRVVREFEGNRRDTEARLEWNATCTTSEVSRQQLKIKDHRKKFQVGWFKVASRLSNVTTSASLSFLDGTYGWRPLLCTEFTACQTLRCFHECMNNITTNMSYVPARNYADITPILRRYYAISKRACNIHSFAKGLRRAHLNQ